MSDEPTFATDRRQALRHLLGWMAAVGADPPLIEAWMGQARDTAPPKHTNGNHRPLAEGNPKFFNPAEYRALTRMVDLIIPRTDTPGAADAGVPIYIDIIVGADDALGRKFRSGLADLDATSRAATKRSFVDASPAQQTKILESMQHATPPANGFFESVKSMTIVGYYSSEIGLFEELHFVGNQMLSSFTGCPHPGHSLDVPVRRDHRAALDPNSAARWPFPTADNITGDDL
jgi:hypothetical protein